MEQQPPAGDRSPEALVISPELTDAQLSRLRGYSTPDALEVGETAFAAGDPSYDLVVIEEAAIEVSSSGHGQSPEASLVRFGRGAFVGELGLLIGHTACLTAVPGRLSRSGRRWTLRLPAHWPWQHDFVNALTRIRALPAAT